MLSTAKETDVHQKRPAKETCETERAYGAVSCWALQTRLMYIKRDQCISRETDVYQKNPTYIKRDSYISKETCKRDYAYKWVVPVCVCIRACMCKCVYIFVVPVCVYVYVCVCVCMWMSYLCAPPHAIISRSLLNSVGCLRRSLLTSSELSHSRSTNVCVVSACITARHI